MDWKSLPKWTYDPVRDTHRITVLDEVAKNPVDSLSNDFLCSKTTHAHTESDNYNDEGLSSDEDFEDSNDNDIHYVWPSDPYPYEALAYSSPFKALAAIVNQGSVSEDSNMTVDFRTPRRIIMVQHRVSTLRVLVRLMREVHKDVFDGISATLREMDFWSNLWFNLDKTWGIISPKLLEERFSWVLEYIRAGKMPRKVLCFKDALRRVWMKDGALLRSAKHPYNYDVGCATRDFLNPDLYPRWVNAIITSDDTMSKVSTRLSVFYGIQITAEKIQDDYGILIADLW